MKKTKKIIGAGLIVLLAGLLFVCGLRHILSREEEKNILRDSEELTKNQFDAIVVLGCGVYKDGSLSPMLQYRLDTASDLFWQGVAPVIFVTGDHEAGEYDEVDHMLEYFYTKNISEEWMIPDYEGHSTYESILHAKEAGFQRILIVTQEYHLTRALYIGEQMGMDCSGFPAQDWSFSWGTVLRHAREYIATLKDYLYCLIK